MIHPLDIADASDLDDALDLCRAATDLLRALSKLTERCRDIVLRYAQGETLDAIGARHGVTRERVRQIRLAALADLAALVRGLPTPAEDRAAQREAQRAAAREGAERYREAALRGLRTTPRSTDPRDLVTHTVSVAT